MAVISLEQAAVAFLTGAVIGLIALILYVLQRIIREWWKRK